MELALSLNALFRAVYGPGGRIRPSQTMVRLLSYHLILQTFELCLIIRDERQRIHFNWQPR